VVVAEVTCGAATLYSMGFSKGVFKGTFNALAVLMPDARVVGCSGLHFIIAAIMHSWQCAPHDNVLDVLPSSTVY